MTSDCCTAAVYVDSVDGGTYCITCDREVDPKTGRVLTAAERLTALCQRELEERENQ